MCKGILTCPKSSYCHETTSDLLSFRANIRNAETRMACVKMLFWFYLPREGLSQRTDLVSACREMKNVCTEDWGHICHTGQGKAFDRNKQQK